MSVQAGRIGDVKVLSTQQVYFEQGLPGFEKYHKFTLLELDFPLPIKLLQSVDDEHISLLVGDPFYFYEDYEWDLPEHTQQELKITDISQIEVWSVIILPTNAADATINLLAPIIINRAELLGKQLILQQSSYSNRHSLFPSQGEG